MDNDEQTISGLGGVKTILFPRSNKMVNDKLDWLKRHKLIPWLFLGGDNVFKMETFDKRKIRYGGVEFEGSPRHVFWSNFIEPFLINFIEEMLNWTSLKCRENNLAPDIHLDETAGLLKIMASHVYLKMADIDQRLRGKAYPESVERMSVSDKINYISQFIDDHLKTEKALWKSRERALNESKPIANNTSEFKIPTWLKVILIIFGAVGTIWGIVELFFKTYLSQSTS